MLISALLTALVWGVILAIIWYVIKDLAMTPLIKKIIIAVLCLIGLAIFVYTVWPVIVATFPLPF